MKLIRIFQAFRRPIVTFRILARRLLGIDFSIWFVNILFQRIFRINGNVPFQVHFTSRVIIGEGVHLGENVWKSLAISGNCYVQGGGGVYIDDNTLIAPGAKIISANHDMADPLARWVSERPIQIGKKCWIGANSVILPGVVLGNETVVGAGAVVAKSYPEGNCVLVGVPARPRT